MNWWVLKRQVHISWLIAAISLSVVVGVYFASIINQGWFGSVIWLINGLLLVGLACWRRWMIVIPFCIFGGLLIGLWRGSTTQMQISAYQQLQGQEITIAGVVEQDVIERSDGQVALRLKDINYQGRPLPGVIWLTLNQSADIGRSDLVTVKGKLNQGFGSFVGSMYRAQLVSAQRPMPGDVALHVRDWFAGKVKQVMPQAEASLGLGYLLGMQRGLPGTLEDNLRVAGLTHVIVASGFHLSVIVRYSRRWLIKLSRFSALAGSGFLIFGFMMITGVSPSMSRAGLVTGLSLLAWYFGHKFHPLVIIAIAAATTVLLVPSYAWQDVGWQLSFAAFAGVMILAPLVQSYFFGDKKPGNIRQIVGETIAAQLATLPILIVTFGYVSNLSVIANLLVLPFVSFAMLLVLIAGLAAWLVPLMADVIALPANWLLDYMIAVVNQIAAVSWVKTEVEVGPLFVVGYYVLLIGACVYMARITTSKLRSVNIVE